MALKKKKRKRKSLGGKDDLITNTTINGLSRCASFVRKNGHNSHYLNSLSVCCEALTEKWMGWVGRWSFIPCQGAHQGDAGTDESAQALTGKKCRSVMEVVTLPGPGMKPSPLVACKSVWPHCDTDTVIGMAMKWSPWGGLR